MLCNYLSRLSSKTNKLILQTFCPFICDIRAAGLAVLGLMLYVKVDNQRFPAHVICYPDTALTNSGLQAQNGFRLGALLAYLQNQF